MSLPLVEGVGVLVREVLALAGVEGLGVEEPAVGGGVCSLPILGAVRALCV